MNIEVEKSRDGLDPLVDDLEKRFQRTFGTAFSKSAVRAWKTRIEENPVLLARQSNRPTGFIVLRPIAGQKTDLALIHAVGDHPRVLRELVRCGSRHVDQETPQIPTQISSNQSWDEPIGRPKHLFRNVFLSIGFRAFQVRILEHLFSRENPVSSPDLHKGYELRPYQPEDLDLCASIMFRSPDLLMNTIPHPIEECRDLIRLPVLNPGTPQRSSRSLVATYENKPCGFCGATADGIIAQLYVLSEHRGRGLGQALLSACLSGFNRQGIARVRLTVIEGNFAACSLYEHSGFQEVSRYPFWYRHSQPRTEPTE
ncbi:MAG: GNAT family N-acetyltransferase [Planctomycetota bacterium]|nr:GNAT family N-acetyltransferase [Planctomycetota bacterium]